MKLVLTLATWALPALGLSAPALSADAIQMPPPDAVETTAFSVPEPAALLVVSLGSVAILLLTTRRK